MPVFSVCDASFKTYALGNLYCHVLAFRIDTEKDFADLQVTDYTSKGEIAGDRPSSLTYANIDVSATEILHVTLNLELFNRLAQKYQEVTGEEFFARLNATLSQNNWVILHEKLCLANLQLKLQKKPTHLMGNVQQAFLLSAETPNIDLFWDRMLERCGLLMLKHASLASKVIASLSPESIERANSYLGPLTVNSDATSYSSESQAPIKEEHSFDDLDLQQQLRDMLEPAFQPAQPHIQTQTQSQYLTQLQSLQQDSQLGHGNHRLPDTYSPQQSLLPESQLPAVSQFPDLLLADEKASGLFTLSQLNRMPMIPNNRIYTTSAYVVGTIPQNLSYICTKVYELTDGQIRLSDPHLEPLELILLDSSEKCLNPDNCLVAKIPKDELMELFSLQYKEQLYTKLEDINKLFSRRKNIRIQLELNITAENAIPLWTTRNLDMSMLLGSR
ncbi:CIC11C00000001412 [Sungouiella intermedia]|uniref:CIC11C00000001412 n=1 Tax=Sungouiella intermedia TaxID=45354 RepID=A0A1L0BNH3_9ASCO|nr:CIC11C00000001412 [[Candida] intermedia]